MRGAGVVLFCLVGVGRLVPFAALGVASRVVGSPTAVGVQGEVVDRHGKKFTVVARRARASARGYQQGTRETRADGSGLWRD